MGFSVTQLAALLRWRLASRIVESPSSANFWAKGLARISHAPSSRDAARSRPPGRGADLPPGILRTCFSRESRAGTKQGRTTASHSRRGMRNAGECHLPATKGCRVTSAKPKRRRSTTGTRGVRGAVDGLPARPPPRPTPKDYPNKLPHPSPACFGARRWDDDLAPASRPAAQAPGSGATGGSAFHSGLGTRTGF